MAKKNAHIAGTGGYQPGEPIPTSKIQELVGELVPEVAEGLSIEQRYWQIDIETGEHRENNSDLAYKASVLALESAGVEPGQVELIINATGTPDYPLPRGREPGTGAAGNREVRDTGDPLRRRGLAAGPRHRAVLSGAGLV